MSGPDDIVPTVAAPSDEPAVAPLAPSAPSPVGFDLDDEPAVAPAPANLDMDWDADSATSFGQASGSWLDLQPEAPTVVAPDPNWPLGPTPSVIPPVLPVPPVASAPAIRPAPVVQPDPQPLPTYEIYRPPTAPRPTAAPVSRPATSPYLSPSYGSGNDWSNEQLAVRQPVPRSRESTTWASAAHWSGLIACAASSGGLGFLGPLIVLLTKGKTDPFVRANAVEALNFYLTSIIFVIISALTILLGVGVIGLFLFPLFYLIFSIKGAVAASRGEPFRYPHNFRMVK